MSIIFGLIDNTQMHLQSDAVIRLSAGTSPWARSRPIVALSGNVGMGIQAHHTHVRSALHAAPYKDEFSNLTVFDGRLDNHQVLSESLGLDAVAVSDAQIVLAAFERWEESMFSRLTGDWALALWNPSNRRLYLARDHAGTRTLYYRTGTADIIWSTYLETFTAQRGDLSLNYDYLLRYMGCGSVGDETPYKEVHSVPPGHFIVRTEDGGVVSRAHWSPLREPLTGGTDADYEEQLFALFAQSVERRIASPELVLAELSGGMDSNANVGMADHIVSRAFDREPNTAVTTVSYFRSDEPAWDERPFFEQTEQGRGQTGIHIGLPVFEFRFDEAPTFSCLPGFDTYTDEKEAIFEDSLGGRIFETILSGLGGDELLGGVPDGSPEIGDCLLGLRVRDFCTATLRWSLASRNTVWNTTRETCKSMASLFDGRGSYFEPPPWTRTGEATAKSHRIALSGESIAQLHSFGVAAISNSLAWCSILNTLPHLFPRRGKRYEFRYPFLDKDLAEFLLAAPREQIIRPSQRRSLMRRALSPVIPEHIRNRRRKAVIGSGLVRAIQSNSGQIKHHFKSSRVADLGLVDPHQFHASVDQICSHSDLKWCRQIRATIAIEQWLRSFESRRGDGHTDQSLLA